MKKRILISDDDVEFCEEMREVFKANGYTVDNESDGLSCERAVRKNSYDIFILDYKMPGLNGIEISRIIKAKDPEAKVFIISGKHNIKEMLEAENALHLVDGFLNKPFDVDGFIEQIKKIK
ncbi:MAG: response regulator [Candidatus Omnitrophica bacterium]|nr:response regulator [Candidatus Omnitrophota bacterium]